MPRMEPPKEPKSLYTDGTRVENTWEPGYPTEYARLVAQYNAANATADAKAVNPDENEPYFLVRDGSYGAQRRVLEKNMRIEPHSELTAEIISKFKTVLEQFRPTQKSASGTKDEKGNGSKPQWAALFDLCDKGNDFVILYVAKCIIDNDVEIFKNLKTVLLKQLGELFASDSVSLCLLLNEIQKSETMFGDGAEIGFILQKHLSSFLCRFKKDEKDLWPRDILERIAALFEVNNTKASVIKRIKNLGQQLESADRRLKCEAEFKAEQLERKAKLTSELGQADPKRQAELRSEIAAIEAMLNPKVERSDEKGSSTDDLLMHKLHRRDYHMMHMHRFSRGHFDAAAVVRLQGRLNGIQTLLSANGIVSDELLGLLSQLEKDVFMREVEPKPQIDEVTTLASRFRYVYSDLIDANDDGGASLIKERCKAIKDLLDKGVLSGSLKDRLNRLNGIIPRELLTSHDTTACVLRVCVRNALLEENVAKLSARLAAVMAQVASLAAAAPAGMAVSAADAKSGSGDAVSRSAAGNAALLSAGSGAAVAASMAATGPLLSPAADPTPPTTAPAAAPVSDVAALARSPLLTPQ